MGLRRRPQQTQLTLRVARGLQDRPCSWGRRGGQAEKGRMEAVIEQDPGLHPPQPTSRGKRNRAGGDESPGALHAWPGDPLWEHESTSHWALVLSGAGHQGELKHSGSLRTLQSWRTSMLH